MKWGFFTYFPGLTHLLFSYQQEVMQFTSKHHKYPIKLSDKQEKLHFLQNTHVNTESLLNNELLKFSQAAKSSNTANKQVKLLLKATNNEKVTKVEISKSKRKAYINKSSSKTSDLLDRKSTTLQNVAKMLKVA